ncbi:hypothetical protein Tco_0588071 [Tanacetum coccineum]
MGIGDFFLFFLLRLLLKALINFFSLALLLLGLSDTKGTIEDSGSSTFSLSSAAIDGNGGTNLVIVVDDVRGIKEVFSRRWYYSLEPLCSEIELLPFILKSKESLENTTCFLFQLQYENKKYPREENAVDGYGNDMAKRKLIAEQKEFETEAAEVGKIRHVNILALKAYYLGPKGEKLLAFD